VGAPAGFERELAPLPPRVDLRRALRGSARFDVVVFYPRNAVELRERFRPIVARLAPAGGFWVAWPKKSSGVPTDLDEGVVRGIGLEGGLVDNKVCAIDEVYSGLRFVVRRADRAAATATARASRTSRP
jgi:hypothetical protein